METVGEVKVGRFGLMLTALCVLLPAMSHRAMAQQKSEITQIDTYAAQVDRFIRRNPKSLRYFGKVSSVDENAARWSEFRTDAEMEKAGTGDNLNERALIWAIDGKLAGADFNFTSPSGDWVHLINYYFRKDGSLAKIDARLNTFYGELSVVRLQYFNAKGVLLKSTRKYLDLNTRKPKKPGGDFLDRDVPVYPNVRALPFHKLL